MSLLLKNCLIADSNSSLHNNNLNLLIENGTITSLKASSADKEIDLNGKILTPGWFDLNANFNDPGNEIKEDLSSGTNVAAAGGFTDVQLVPNTNPTIETKSDVEYIKNSSNDRTSLYVSAALSEGIKGENLTEILDLHAAGASSISDGDAPIWNTELLMKGLQYTAQIDIPIFQFGHDIHLSQGTHLHEGKLSTNLGLRGEPSLSEFSTIKRDIDVLRYSGGRLHFSKVSTKESVKLIKEAKKEGLNVTADVAIHNLIFTDESIGEFDTIQKVSPPYRSEKDRRALINGLKSGVIDAICSNHRPQNLESKQLEFDLAETGSISLQTFYHSLLTLAHEIPFDTLINKISSNPRKILGLGQISIEEGMPAKLAILDPTAKWTLDSSSNLSKSINSPFWGKELIGKVFGTINQNHINIFD